jgi:hypothetical protein
MFKKISKTSLIEILINLQPNKTDFIINGLEKHIGIVISWS